MVRAYMCPRQTTHKALALLGAEAMAKLQSPRQSQPSSMMPVRVAAVEQSTHWHSWLCRPVREAADLKLQSLQHAHAASLLLRQGLIAESEVAGWSSRLMNGCLLRLLPVVVDAKA